MTKNPRRILLAAAALAAVTVPGCSLATGATPVKATPAPPVTVTQAPSTPSSAPTITVTAMPPPPPVTLTVTPPLTPAPAAHYTGTGAFQSPSGNIHCALFSYDDQTSARCDVADHSWAAPPPGPDCHLGFGSRVLLIQGAPTAVFDCYGQELPAPDRTLAYGESWSIGSLTCDSQPVGMACADSSTGRSFFVARETYRLG